MVRLGSLVGKVLAPITGESGSNPDPGGNFSFKLLIYDLSDGHSESKFLSKDMMSKLRLNHPSGAFWIIKIEKSSPNLVKCEGLLTVFFDYNGLVHYEFMPKGCKVNKVY